MRKKISKIIWLFAIVAAATVYWWVDSYLTCEHQEVDSLRGACLLKVKNNAIDGAVGAQWSYADYLFFQGEKEKSQEWYQVALKNSKDGLDLLGALPELCDKRPGLDYKVVEAKISEVVKNDSDANLLLFELYITRRCGAFSLEKATLMIPILNQCAYLTISEYLRISRDMNFHIKNETFSQINRNIEICWQEIADPSRTMNRVREMVHLNEKSIREFAALVSSMQH